MPGDEKDKAGVVAPPPLIYLVALVFGLLLNRSRRTAFLPRTIARILGWPLLGGGVCSQAGSNGRCGVPIHRLTSTSRSLT
jgi:hypothetical protein